MSPIIFSPIVISQCDRGGCDITTLFVFKLQYLLRRRRIPRYYIGYENDNKLVKIIVSRLILLSQIQDSLKKVIKREDSDENRNAAVPRQARGRDAGWRSCR